MILTRAGLGLDPVALRRLSFGVIRLAFIPCLVETLVAAVCSHLLLGFPWIWGFMLGYVSLYLVIESLCNSFSVQSEMREHILHLIQS